MQNQTDRIRLSKHFKLPNDLKTPWFLKMAPADRRAHMLACQISSERAKSQSKRDAETYAENPQNSRIGR